MLMIALNFEFDNYCFLGVVVQVTKVSICMSSYNYANYLNEAIDSVLNQSFKDYELFIIDDASIDDSWSIIQSYHDPRIFSYRNLINRNDREWMRKVIFENASGEYIAIHHSDNVWEPQKLQKQVDFLDSHPEIGAVFTSALIIDEYSKPFENKSHFYYSIFDQPNRTRQEWLNFFFYHGNALCHPSILIRKNCYEDCGFYRNGFIQLPDFEMWVRLCMKFEIHVIPEKLIRFRVISNEMNISGSREDSRIRNQFENLQLLENYRSIPTIQELELIFPQAKEFIRANEYDKDYILARIALKSNVGNPAIHLFGLRLLFEIFDDPSRADRLRELHGFTRKDYRALTGKYDVFSTEEKNCLFWQLKEKDQTISALISQVAVKDKVVDAISDQLIEIKNDRKLKIISSLGQWTELFAPNKSIFNRILHNLYRVLILPTIRLIQNQRLQQDISLIRSSGIFDVNWYLEKYPDVADEKIDPFEHYLIYGGFEGRDPGPGFSSEWYLRSYSDVKIAGMNPLIHYIKYGMKERRPLNLEHHD